MKNLFTPYLIWIIFFLINSNPLLAQYSNATLNGSWFFYTEPLNPYDDELNYAIFDGNGNITNASGFPTPASGNYTVNQNGSFSGTAFMGSETFPFVGQLTSQNGGTINFGDGNNILSKIPNPGALQDKIVGTLITQNYGTKNITLNIDSQGKIISASGLTPPVSGYVYADLGVYLGHFTTADAVPWNEFSIMGYYINDELNGQVVLDSSDEGITFCQLTRYDNPPDNTDWKLQTNPAEATTEVGKIQFVSATEGWISISPGGLLHTTDGGTTWARKRLDPTDILCSIIDPAINMCFINPSIGWVIKTFGTDVFFDSHGAVIYKTTDGGLNWQKTVLSQVDGDMGGQIQFIDANNGYCSIYNSISGLGKYYRTTDGGTIWNEISTDGTIGILYQVDLNNSWGISGVVSDYPPYTILYSSNSMNNYTHQFVDYSEGKFNAIQFTDMNHGWVVGERGKILNTDDGENWIPITNTGITADYTCKSVYFINATTGWIGAQLDNSSYKITATNYAIILHTTDGGASWTTQTTPTLNPYSIFFWDANNGWLTSEDNKIAYYSSPLGIKENLTNKYLTIYPNPNTGTFYFRLKDTNSKIQIEIYTISGQKVYKASKKENQTSNEVNFTPQTKGIYLIKINDEENSYSEKIMIK